MDVVFHRLFQNNLSIALRYYDEEGGSQLGDRFFAEVDRTIARVAESPKRHHFIAEGLRRVQLRVFPYHILFEGDDGRVRISDSSP